MAEALTIEFEFRNQRFSSAEKGLRYYADTLEENIDRTGPVLSKELRSFLGNVAEALSQRHSKAWPGGTGPQTLSKRAGGGMASIKQSITVTGKTLDDIIGSIGGDFYLRTHEFGATIRAKRVKFLTIPLPAALNANGTPKKMSAREWDRTFVRRSKKGNLIIFTRSGKSLIPLYLLKKEVKIPPRLGMQKTLEVGLPRFVDKAMEAMLKEILK